MLRCTRRVDEAREGGAALGDSDNEGVEIVAGVVNDELGEAIGAERGKDVEHTNLTPPHNTSDEEEVDEGGPNGEDVEDVDEGGADSEERLDDELGGDDAEAADDEEDDDEEDDDAEDDDEEDDDAEDDDEENDDEENDDEEDDGEEDGNGKEGTDDDECGDGEECGDDEEGCNDDDDDERGDNEEDDVTRRGDGHAGGSDAAGCAGSRWRRRKCSSKKMRTSGRVRMPHMKLDWPMPWNLKMNMASTLGQRLLVHVFGSARDTPGHAASK